MHNEPRDRPSVTSSAYDPFLTEWNSDDGLSGDQIMALADALDFNALDFGQFDWLETDLPVL